MQARALTETETHPECLTCGWQGGMVAMPDTWPLTHQALLTILRGRHKAEGFLGSVRPVSLTNASICPEQLHIETQLSIPYVLVGHLMHVYLLFLCSLMSPFAVSFFSIPVNKAHLSLSCASSSHADLVCCHCLCPCVVIRSLQQGHVFIFLAAAPLSLSFSLSLSLYTPLSLSLSLKQLGKGL